MSPETKAYAAYASQNAINNHHTPPNQAEADGFLKATARLLLVIIFQEFHLDMTYSPSEYEILAYPSL